MNPASSAVTKSQPAQPEKYEAPVYGFKSDLCSYGLFPAGHMGTKVRVTCDYNYPP